MSEITLRPTARRTHRATAIAFSLALGAGTLTGVGTIAAADTAQAAESTYTVRPGDGWWVISERTGVSMSTLQTLNGMTAATMLHPDMVLKTSGATTAAPAPAPAPTAGTYTVRPGDGWWVISERTGVSMSRLQALNGMTAATELHPYMVLKTTGTVAAAPAPAPAPTPAPAPAPVRQAGTKQAAIDHMVAKVRNSSTYYQWGGTGDYGYDCSGLVQEAMAESGYSIPRTSHDQYRGASTYVSLSQAQPGDLVFWMNQSTGRVYHVAMYIGDGKIAHALNPDADLVITDMDIMRSNMLSVVGRY